MEEKKDNPKNKTKSSNEIVQNLLFFELLWNGSH